MPTYPNLISESILINETIQLLQSFGGKTTAVKIVDNVMQIRKPEPTLAKKLVMDLVNSDPRLSINDDLVELVPLNHEARNLFDSDFVVFDLETTGAKCPPCRVTEIGAFRISNSKIVDKFHSLVNPETPIPSFITQLTGISDQMVRNAPKFLEVADDFLKFIGDSILVAHNASFDIRFLNHEISKIYGNYKIANPHLCTVQLSRKLVPHIENHKLNTVAQHFCVNLENHHRASQDAHATAKIFINLLEDLQNRGVSDLGSVKKIKF